MLPQPFMWPTLIRMVQGEGTLLPSGLQDSSGEDQLPWAMGVAAVFRPERPLPCSLVSGTARTQPQLLLTSSFYFSTYRLGASGHCKQRHLHKCYGLDRICPQSLVPRAEWLRQCCLQWQKVGKETISRGPWSQRS